MKHDDGLSRGVADNAKPRRPAPRAAPLVVRFALPRKGDRVRPPGRGAVVVTTSDQVSYRIYRLASARREECPFRCFAIQRLAAPAPARAPAKGRVFGGAGAAFPSGAILAW